MTGTSTRDQSDSRTATGIRLCVSIGLFMLCNFVGAAVIPLIAMASA